MAKVFVSYSRKDIEFAKRLTAELQKNDLDFWIDWEGIPPTVDWWREIEKGIEEADVFVFLISPDSSKSQVCGQEIDCAVKNSKRIIPLVVREVKGGEAPQQLSHLNWIFVRESDDYNAALQKLLTAMHTDYEWVQAHRRLQVKALEWERNHKDHGFLLRGKDLLDAETNLAENTSKEPHPTDLQRSYVFESRKATDRQKRITTGISIAGVIALAALAVFGFVQAALAKAEARHATVGKLALESKTSLESFPQRSLLLALEAVRLNQNADEPVSPEAEEALRFAVERVSGINPGGLDHAVWFTRFVQDEKTGTWLIAGSTDRGTQVRIWNMDRLMRESGSYIPFEMRVPAPPEDGPILPTVDKSPQDTWLITNATEGYSLWQIADADEERTPIHFEAEPQFIDPGDDSLVLEQQSEQVILWRLDVQSLNKVEIGRFDGEYSEVSPQYDSIIISTDHGDQIVTLPENGNDLRTIEFEGSVDYANPRSGHWVFEYPTGQAILWKVDFATGQKKEVHRFAGEYDYLVVDPQEKWLIAFEAITHPDIMVTFSDEMGEMLEPEPWVSNTIHIYALNHLQEPVSSIALQESAYLGEISPDGKRMLFDANILPDEYGNSNTKLGMINFDEDPPTIYISSTSSYYPSPKFINEHWLLEYESFYDLRDADLEADAVDDSGLVFDNYLYALDPSSLELTEDGKYLIAGRKRVDLNALDKEHELVIEPNPDADPSQTDVAKLLRFDPLKLGVEGEVSAAAISPDGHWIVAGTIDGSVRLWNNERPWASSIQMGPSSPYMIALSNDNKWLATGGTFWKLEDGIPTSTYKIPLPDGNEQDYDTNGGVFSPDSHWFIHLAAEPINDTDIQINVSLIDMTHDLFQPIIEPDSIGEPGKIYNTIQFSRDSKWVVLGGGTVGMYAGDIGSFLFDLENRISYPLPIHAEAVFSTGQDHLILIPPDSYDEVTQAMSYPNPEIWSLPKQPGDSPEKIGTFDTQGQHVIVSNNGRWLATSSDTTAGRFDVATPRQVWDVNCMIEGTSCKPFTISTYAASFSPDSRYLMLAWATDMYGFETDYEVWDMQPWESNENTQPRKVASRHSATFNPVIGKTGGLAVLRKDESCDYFGRPRSTAVLSSTWTKHPWLANLSTFDGYAYMEIGGGGGGGGGEASYHVDYRAETLTWNGREYESILLRGHESSVTAVQVSPDERFVLTFSGGTGTYCGERENLLRLWDMTKLKEDPLTKPVILPLKDDAESPISHLAFSPDSHWIYVIDSKNVLYYFPTSVETLAIKACNAAGRNFIINEWERFFPGETYRKTCENLPVHPSVNVENAPVPSE